MLKYSNFIIVQYVSERNTVYIYERACVCGELCYRNTQRWEQWGLKGRKENKSVFQEGKDEKDWKREWEKEVKASLEIDGVIVDCWSALILVSQGCCLRELASCSLSNLCLSQDWSKPGNLYTFLYFFPTLTLYSSQSLLFYLLSVILLWSHPIGHVSVLFPSLPSDSQTPCREQWTGKEQQERGGGATSRG